MQSLCNWCNMLGYDKAVILRTEHLPEGKYGAGAIHMLGRYMSIHDILV